MHLHKQCLATSSTLSCAYWPFTNFLWRNVYSSPLPILQSGSLFFCCSVFSSLNIWIIIIYQIHNLQAFSPTLWFAFLFCEQCLWIHRCSKFSCSPISLFFSVICAFGVTSKKILPHPMSWSLCPTFPAEFYCSESYTEVFDLLLIFLFFISKILSSWFMVLLELLPPKRQAFSSCGLTEDSGAVDTQSYHLWWLKTVVIS